jgi:hypothetical protein
MLATAAAIPPIRMSDAAIHKRRRRIRRFASAISGSSENGRRGTRTVIAPLSLAPHLSSSALRSRDIPRKSVGNKSTQLTLVDMLRTGINDIDASPELLALLRDAE